MEIQGNRVAVFCPEAEVLGEKDLAKMPKETREHPTIKGKKGVWLSVFCPEESCLTEDQKVMVPIIVAEGSAEGKMKGGKPEKRGLWLRMFCPEDQCWVERPTDLP